MITLECASLKGLLECASLSVSEGKTCVVLTETDIERNMVLKIITGLARVDSGKVFIFGKEISSISYDELNELRKRLGVVMNNGGLVSNLKVWENIMLPLAYHKSLSDHGMEEKMMRILGRIGYDDDVTRLSGPLPPFKKRLVGLVRAMLMEPDIMIYDYISEGLSVDFKSRLLDTINTFHGEKKGRTSVFLESGSNVTSDIKADSIFILKKGIFHERN